jgi:hypothetical protein
MDGRVSGAASVDTEPAGDQRTPDPASPGTGGAAVEVTVAIDDQRALGRLDAAAVDVRYPAKQRKGVLTVPVGALLALAEGGYGLEVVDGQGSQVLPVTVGMFAGGRVEVSGEGVTEGLPVGLPA